MSDGLYLAGRWLAGPDVWHLEGWHGWGGRRSTWVDLMGSPGRAAELNCNRERAEVSQAPVSKVSAFGCVRLGRRVGNTCEVRQARAGEGVTPVNRGHENTNAGKALSRIAATLLWVAAVTSMVGLVGGSCVPFPNGVDPPKSEGDGIPHAEWRSLNGPLNDYIPALIIHPDDDNVLFIASSGGNGVLRSGDRGDTWELRSDGMDVGYVLDLVMDPINTDVLYAGDAGGRIYKTTDAGEHWMLSNRGMEGEIAPVWSLAIDPTDPSIVYAGLYKGVDGQLYKSGDAGGTWTRIDAGFPEMPLNVSDVLIDPENPQTVYASTGFVDAGIGQGVFKSTDGGASWLPINNGLDELTVSDLVMDPRHPKTLYAATGSVDDEREDPTAIYLYVTHDGGATWKPVSTAPTDYVVSTLTFAQDESTLLFGGYGRFYAMDTSLGTVDRLDSGVDVIGENFLFSYVLATPTVSEGTMYAGTYAGGLLKSTDGGGQWRRVNGELPGTLLLQAYGLAVDRSNGGRLYVNTYGGLHRFDRSTNQWSYVQNDLGSVLLDSVAVAPSDANRLYVGTNQSGLWRSDDAAAHWTSVLGEGPYSIPVLAVHPQQPDVVWAGLVTEDREADPGGVLVTRDGGERWTRIVEDLESPDVYSLAVDPADPNVVYAGTTSGGFYRLDEMGVHSAKPAGLTFSSVRALLVTDGRMFGGTGGLGAFASDDGGDTWRELPDLPRYVNVLATGGDTDDVLYAGTGGPAAVWRSKDGGESWALLHRFEVEFGWVNDLHVDHRNSQTFYAAIVSDAGRGGAVHRSSDGGLTWHERSTGLPGLGVTAVTRIVDGRLLAATFGAGVYQSVDDGESWAPLSTVLSEMRALCLYETDGALLVGTHGDGIWYSSDSGHSFTAATGVPDANAFASAHAAAIKERVAGELVAATAEGAFVSSDGGSTWTGVSDGLPALDLRSLAITPSGHVLTGSAGYGVFKGVRNASGFAWSGNGEPMPLRPASEWAPRERIPIISDIDVSPANPSVVRVAVYPIGMYVSEDRGTTWAERSTGLFPGTEVSVGIGREEGFLRLASDPSNPATVFMSTYGGRVFASLNGGLSWMPIHNPTLPTSAFGLEFDSDTGELCVALRAGGVFSSMPELPGETQGPRN